MTGSGGSLDATTSRTDEWGVATVTLTTTATPGVTCSVGVGRQRKVRTSRLHHDATSRPGFDFDRFGAASSCRIATDGKAWCWGANDTGQLGNGNRVERSFPGRVAGNYTLGVASRRPVSNTTFGIAGGVVLYWGTTNLVRLGDNTTVFAPGADAHQLVADLHLGVGERKAHHMLQSRPAAKHYCWGSV